MSKKDITVINLDITVFANMWFEPNFGHYHSSRELLIDWTGKKRKVPRLHGKNSHMIETFFNQMENFSFCKSFIINLSKWIRRKKKSKMKLSSSVQNNEYCQNEKKIENYRFFSSLFFLKKFLQICQQKRNSKGIPPYRICKYLVLII